MSDDTQFLKEELERTKKACRALSNHTVRERTIVAGFLNVLKIPYQDNEIRKEGPEPIDIWFRSARFQVMEKLGKGRRRGDELRNREEKLDQSSTLIELFVPVEPGNDSLSPTAFDPDKFFQIILSCSQDKLDKYGRVDGDIDFLVYINMKGRYLSPLEPWPDPALLQKHGWRSVSFVDNARARVLYARENAPDFLLEAMGKTYLWPVWDPKIGNMLPIFGSQTGNARQKRTNSPQDRQAERHPT